MANPEFILGLLGMIVVASFIGLLIFQGLTQDTPLPRLEVSVGEIVEAEPHYQVQVTIENSSPATAAGVEIAGTLTQNDKTIEEASATVPFVPGDSSRRAVLLFDEDPRSYTLDVKPMGYEIP